MNAIVTVWDEEVKQIVIFALSRCLVIEDMRISACLFTVTRIRPSNKSLGYRKITNSETLTQLSDSRRLFILTCLKK